MVVGLARSGVGAANLLVRQGRQVVVTDMKAEAELRDAVKGLEPSVRLALGGHPDGLIEGAELVVMSPGVPSDIDPVSRARKGGVEVIGELELAWRAFEHTPFHAVTGTNGKSTVVSLLALMIESSGRKCLLGGNIGKPLSAEAAAGESADCVVVEVSSFQLETIDRFHAQGAAVLNVTPDHLDRYDSMEGYMAAKAEICRNQSEGDVLVLNADDPGCASLKDRHIKDVPGREVLYFSRAGEVRGCFVRDGHLYLNTGGEHDGALIACEDIRIKGVHNLENAMAASLLAISSGCLPAEIAEALREFPGLEHRVEFVREAEGVSYLNDSKGTNVDAVMKSLEGFSNQKVVLIAGGRDKGSDFSPLKEVVDARCRAMVLIGEAAQKMGAALSGNTRCEYAVDMDEAVRMASWLASPGDAVLLSPACASFDMFRDFEERGRRFKEAVRAL
ncbi:MAG: UDP-N-acetylmuramoyl-L-alanine--D-glutamate ligase [Thermodesulfovibrionales bacterium]|nr:UDP-N-acetylmuramoyl-L-alanine--D-glutamate ligase [Thermodesulfovibrionales bacterium]